MEKTKPTYLIVSDAIIAKSNNGTLIIRDLWAREIIMRCKMYRSTFNLRILGPRVHHLTQGEISNPYIVENEFRDYFKLLPPFSVSKVLTKSEFQNSLWTSLLGFFSRLPFLMKAILILTREIKDSHIVHSNASPHPIGIITKIFGKIFNKKQVLVIDADYIGDFEYYISKSSGYMKYILMVLKSIYERMFTLAILCSDVVFVIGNSLYQRFIKYHPRLHRMPSAWYYRYEQEVIPNKSIYKKIVKLKTKQKLDIVFAGKFIEKKGIDILIEIIKKADKSKFNFHIYGAGPYKKEIINLATSENNVFYHGLVPYGEQFFNTLFKYDVTIILTRGNEEPRLIYDAWLSGVCVILPYNETTKFRVINYVTGVFHEFDAENIINILDKLYKDRDTLSKIIYKSKRESEKFSIDNTIKNQLTLITKIFSDNNMTIR